jgi:general secretion pathway protein G
MSMKTSRPNPDFPFSIRVGFTLIEMMLVVLIIGILATIVVVNMSDNSNKARKTATIQTIEQIKLAIAQYEMDKGKYPESLSDLVSGEKHYLDSEKVPVDSWGHEFKYYIKGDLIKVESAGPDGVFETADDIPKK